MAFCAKLSALGLVVLLAIIGSGSAATLTANSESSLKSQFSSAANGDTIVLANSFNITSGFFINGKTITFTATSPVVLGLIPQNAIRISGDSSKVVAFSNIIFNGFSIPHFDSAIKISSTGGSSSSSGLLVTFTSVTFTNFVDQATNIAKGRGAVFLQNTGTTVAVIGSTVISNFAFAGGALSNTGRSKLYVCDSNFISNSASSAFLINGVSASVVAPDVWVGIGSLFTYVTLTGKTYSTPVAAGNRSSVLTTRTGFSSCPSVGIVFPSTSSNSAKLLKKMRLLY